MAPSRRSKGIRGWSLVIFVLAANVAYQGTRYLWRPTTGATPVSGHQREKLEIRHRDDRRGGALLHHGHGAGHGHGFHDAGVHRDDDDVEVIEEVVYEDVVVEDEGHHGSSRGGASSGGERGGDPEPSGIHVMATSNGSPYQNWQTRIMYRTFLDAAKNSDMKHFTRLLHRRTDDELMAEVPTVRVDSLHAECDRWCEFPVADRPDAIKKWLATPDSRRGEWILMIEMDYVWKKAVPMPEPGSPAVAFHFNYINPNYPRLPEVMRSLMPPEQRDEIKMEDIPCTGPAPTMIRRVDLVPLMDEYERIAAAIEADPVAKQRLGWVREMYAYDLAAAIIGVKHVVQDPGETIMIAQPPADAKMGRASMYHYTWGAEYFRNGEKVWSWDKRPYVETKHVRQPAKFKPELPPADGSEGVYNLQDGKKVSKGTDELLRDMLTLIRGAIDRLDELPHQPGCGWDQGEPECDFGCEPGKLCEPAKVWKAREV